MAPWLDKLIVSESRKKDLRKEDMPKTRVQLFFAVLKVRFWSFFGLNGLAMIFTWPILVMILAAFSSNVIQKQAPLLQVSQYLMTVLIAFIPLLMIAGIGWAGLWYVMNTWAFDESEWTWNGFWEGVKTHWKQSVLLQLFNGMMLFILVYCFLFYFTNAEGNKFYQYAMFTILFCQIILLLMNLYAYPLMMNYRMKFKTILRNSFLFAMARLPFSLVALLGVLVLPMFLASVLGLDKPLALVGLFMYFTMLGMSTTAFILCSYTHSAFDRFLNPRIPGAIVNRGLASAAPSKAKESQHPLA